MSFDSVSIDVIYFLHLKMRIKRELAVPIQYTLTEGQSQTEVVTFDDIGFAPELILDWSVTSVHYSGSATEGSDYSVTHRLTDAGMRITVRALHDFTYEGTESFTANVSGFVNWVGPGPDPQFYTNIFGDLVRGTSLIENISDSITVTILDSDPPPVPFETNLLEILKGLQATTDALKRLELTQRLDDMLDAHDWNNYPFPDLDFQALPEEIELVLRDRIGHALDALDVGTRVTDIATAENPHKELWLQSWDVVVGFDVTAGASLAAGAAVAALSVPALPAALIVGAVGVGASLIYTNYIQDTVRDVAGRQYDQLYPDQNIQRISTASSMTDLLAAALEDEEAPAHYFDHSWYLNTYADARAAIVDGTYETPFDHWLTVGIDLGYSPNATGIVLTRDDLAFDTSEYEPFLSAQADAPILQSYGLTSVAELADLTEFAPDTLGVGTDGNDNTEDLTPIAWLGNGNDVYRYFGQGQEVDLGEGRDTAIIRGLPGELSTFLAEGGGGLDRLILRTGHEIDADLGAGSLRLLNSDGEEVWMSQVSGFEYLDVGRGGGTIIGGDGNETLIGTAGSHTILGMAGNDRLFGGPGNDILDGEEGSDRMEGGLGIDIFVFSEGQDTVHDFDVLTPFERIDLSEVDTITNYVDLRVNHLSEVNGNAVINDARGNTLTLEGIALADLTRGDFIL